MITEKDANEFVEKISKAHDSLTDLLKLVEKYEEVESGNIVIDGLISSRAEIEKLHSLLFEAGYEFEVELERGTFKE